MPEWTPAQQNAINSRNGTILVSAAAGSGKTAVLVERVIQRIEDEKNLCPADSLLIVTFTKAATAQMREKIAAALDKRIEENPENQHLQKQRMLLPFANISTIDSFCGDLVKENFHELGISPDYKIAEGAELNLMKHDAVEFVLEKAYKENRAGFSQLVSILFSGDSDSNLSDLIISLYNTSRAYAFPDKWLDSFINDYENAKLFTDTPWGKYIINYLCDLCNYHLKKLIREKETFNDEMNLKNGELFSELICFIEDFINIIKEGDWDRIAEAGADLPAGRISNAKTYDYYERAKNVRQNARDDIKDAVESFLYCSQADFEEDTAELIPVINELVRLVKEFDREFSEIKRKAEAADFSDICAYALKLLIKEIDAEGKPVKTELANSISERFTEILVDEFQDINEQQNLLFRVLSKNESNLFMVGDVKQSIYKFRLAMPEIFINIKKSLPDYIDNNYPAKINLDFNFRSRKGVTDYVNFVFSQLMSENAGDVDYDEAEELKPKALYKESTSPDTEIYLLRDTDEFGKNELEAEYAAQYIENAIKSGLTVKDGDGVRKAEYRDFCILLQKAKGKSDIYISALKKRGIPCFSSNSEGYFEAAEIRTVLSVMRIIDNPLQDIPLISAMISPVFGFTPDEIAELRNEYPDLPYWHCVKNAAEHGVKKCAAMTRELKRLRSLSVTLGAGEFLRELLDSTGYLSTVRAMPNGSQRAANLSLLLEYADKYEQSGHIGLSGFIRFIDRVENSKKDFETAKDVSENANVVRLMTVHKSKGLEFPVCIFADCSSKFYDDFSGGYANYSMKYGIGFQRVIGAKRFKTLPYSAISSAYKRDERSESLRLLYVALTRAKEKTVCLLKYGNPEKAIASAMSKLDKEKAIAPLNVINCTNFSDMLLMASLKHFDSNSIPAVSECRTVDTLTCESPVLFKIIDDFSDDETNISTENTENTVDSELIRLIEERAGYEYPYSNLSYLAAKVSPSQLEKKSNSTEYYAKAKPLFMGNAETHAASKGTAVHKFMEFYDYNSQEKDVRRQAQTMLSENKLSAAEEKLLEYDKLSDFFQSETAKRIATSAQVEREKKITFSVGADEIYGNDYSADEKIIVQGYIDCAFIENSQWVIVDYKTDRINDMDILAERYSAQLKMYEKALYECTGIPVKETVIYSLYKNEIMVIK